MVACSLKVSLRWVREGEEKTAAGETDKISGGALTVVPLSYSLPVAVGMLLFNVVVFSPTILLPHPLALHCKGSGFPYSVDSGSLYKAVGHDPYSSPIHRGSGRPAGSSVFPREEFCCRWERDKCLGVGGINGCVKHLCQHLGLERIREKHLPLPLQHKPAEETAIV